MTDLGIAIDSSTETGGRGAFRMFLRNKAAVAGLVVFTFIVLVTIFGPAIYGQEAHKMAAGPFLGPGDDAGPLLGTDYLGRDILAGVITGGRTTLFVAAVAGTMAMGLGLVVGSLAGYFGGWIDALLMRFTEIFQAMPSLLFSLVLIYLMGPGTWKETLAIGLTLWALPARLTRAEFLRLREMEFVKASRAIGSHDLRIMTRTILPNAHASPFGSCHPFSGHRHSLPCRSGLPRHGGHQHDQLGINNGQEQELHPHGLVDGGLPRYRHRHHRAQYRLDR